MCDCCFVLMLIVCLFLVQQIELDCVYFKVISVIIRLCWVLVGMIWLWVGIFFSRFLFIFSLFCFCLNVILNIFLCLMGVGWQVGLILMILYVFLCLFFRILSVFGVQLGVIMLFDILWLMIWVVGLLQILERVIKFLYDDIWFVFWVWVYVVVIGESFMLFMK